MAASKKTAKPKKPTTAAAPKDVRVPVDATLKRRFDALAEIIDVAKGRGAAAFDVLWEAVARVVDHEPPLYVVGGYKNAAEYFREALGESERNARRFVRVARYASPKDEKRYGVTKLDAALAFVEAKLGAPLAEPPLPVALDRLRIPVTEGKSVRHVSLEQASEDQIRAAARALLKSGRAAPRSAAQAALAKALGGVGSLAEVHVRVKAGKASFTGVPLAALGTFARAIARAEVTDGSA